MLTHVAVQHFALYAGHEWPPQVIAGLHGQVACSGVLRDALHQALAHAAQKSVRFGVRRCIRWRIGLGADQRGHDVGVQRVRGLRAGISGIHFVLSISGMPSFRVSASRSLCCERVSSDLTVPSGSPVSVAISD